MECECVSKEIIKNVVASERSNEHIEMEELIFFPHIFLATKQSVEEKS